MKLKNSKKFDSGHTYRIAGMTLIELMIVVAIIGILAAIAYPSYAQYIQRARRADVQGELSRLMDQQEIFYNANRTYTAALADINGRATTEHYNIALATCPAPNNNILNCVMATATPRAGTSQVNDTDCVSMSLTTTGLETAVDSGSTNTSAICWQS